MRCCCTPANSIQLCAKISIRYATEVGCLQCLGMARNLFNNVTVQSKFSRMWQPKCQWKKKIKKSPTKPKTYYSWHFYEFFREKPNLIRISEMQMFRLWWINPCPETEFTIKQNPGARPWIFQRFKTLFVICGNWSKFLDFCFGWFFFIKILKSIGRSRDFCFVLFLYHEIHKYFIKYTLI